MNLGQRSFSGLFLLYILMTTFSAPMTHASEVNAYYSCRQTSSGGSPLEFSIISGLSKEAPLSLLVIERASNPMNSRVIFRGTVGKTSESFEDGFDSELYTNFYGLGNEASLRISYNRDEKAFSGTGVLGLGNYKVKDLNCEPYVAVNLPKKDDSKLSKGSRIVCNALNSAKKEQWTIEILDAAASRATLNFKSIETSSKGYTQFRKVFVESSHTGISVKAFSLDAEAAEEVDVDEQLLASLTIEPTLSLFGKASGTKLRTGGSSPVSLQCELN
jgi:hypothetical protein